MADILDVIKGSQKKINIEKLSALCSKKNVWDYFDIEREDFFELSKKPQLELTSEFYFDHVRRAPTIDDSIIHAISSSDGLNLKKVYDGDKTEMSIETSSGDKKKSKTVNMWSYGGFFLGNCANFNIEKANLPENTLMYVNQGYKTLKDSKKCYYNDLYIIAQIMPLAEPPKDIESYECEDDEVKILRVLYDKETGKFWGIEQYVAQITVRDDEYEEFLTMAMMVKAKQPDFIVKRNVKFQTVLRQHALDF